MGGQRGGAEGGSDPRGPIARPRQSRPEPRAGILSRIDWEET